MDENAKQILHEYIDKNYGARLQYQGIKIGGLQLMFVTLVLRLHQAGVVSAEDIQGDLEKLAEKFSVPDDRALPDMAREINKIIDVALGKAFSN